VLGSSSAASSCLFLGDSAAMAAATLSYTWDIRLSFEVSLFLFLINYLKNWAYKSKQNSLN
jgi:hypothetical protein